MFQWSPPSSQSCALITYSHHSRVPLAHFEMSRSRCTPVDEAGELLCAARKLGADRAETEDDMQPVADTPQEEGIQVICCVRHTCSRQASHHVCSPC